MSKEARFRNREYRREAQRALRGYAGDLRKQLGVFNEALKPKPKYVPQALWKWAAGFFIDIPKLQRALNPQPPELTKSSDRATMAETE